MAYDANSGVSKLGAVLQDRMQKVGSLTPPALDIGEIQGDYSLKCNNFSKAIPRSEYSVLIYLTTGATGGYLTSTSTPGKHGGHESGDGSHNHSIAIPDKLRAVGPGDRVLVAWVNQEAVVVGRMAKL